VGEKSRGGRRKGKLEGVKTKESVEYTGAYGSIGRAQFYFGKGGGREEKGRTGMPVKEGLVQS